MSKDSNTEGKVFVLKMRFIVALVAHTVSGDSLFTIIWCIYNLDGTMLITSDEIVDTKSEMKKNLHAEYGIDGVTDPFKIN